MSQKHTVTFTWISVNAVYCEKPPKHISTLCRKNTEFVIANVGLRLVTTVFQKVKLERDLTNKKLHYCRAAYFR